MIFRSTVGVVFLLVSHLSALTGQEIMELPDEIRKEMKFLVGDWTFEAKEDGKETTGRYSTRWASGGTCLTMTFRSDRHDSTGLSSWDPASKEIVEIWTGPATGRLELRYRVLSDKVWEGTSTLSGIDGQVSHGKIRVEKTGEDSFRYTETTGDKTWDIENQRITRSGAGKKPHAKELAAFVGNWETTLPSGGKRLWTIDWSPGKDFLNNQLTNLDSEGNTAWTINGMLGWDEGMEQVTNWCVGGNGARFHFVWRKLDSETWEAVSESGKATWKFTPMGDKLRVVVNGNEMLYEKQ